MRPQYRITAAVLAAAFVLCSCGRRPAASALPQAVPVKEFAVVEGEFSPSAELAARVKPFRSVTLTSRVNGFLTERSFREGSYVKKGTVLYRIERSQYELARADAAARLAAAEARLVNAQLQFRRTKELLESHIAPPSEFDLARAELDSASASLNASKAALAQAELNLSYTVISAPFDGWIGLSRADAGVYISGPSQTLASILFIDEVRVEFGIPDSFLPPEFREKFQSGVPPGLAVSLEVPGSGEVLSGRLEFWENAVEVSTASLPVQAVFPNPRRALMPGMFVRVKLSEVPAKKHLMIDSEAIRRNGSGTFVFVRNAEGTAEARPVETEPGPGRFSLVLRGLSRGEKAVVSALPLLRPGVKTEVVP